MIYLPRIYDDPRVPDELEEEIKRVLYNIIYGPISRVLMDHDKIQNKATSKDALVSAIESAQISFYRASFRGKFSSAISRRLRDLGATWDAKEKAYRIVSSKLPKEVREAIAYSKSTFDRKAIRIDEVLAQILPDSVVDQLKLTKFFDSAFYKVDADIKSALTVEANLTEEGRQRLAKEYEDNYRIKIKDFTKKEVAKLRRAVVDSAMQGNRYEYMVDKIQKSYGVSASRARTLARQETNMVMSKYKEIRYQEAGLAEYDWICVAGTKAHPVRASHLKLNGKRFRFDKPPVVDDAGRRANPGEDFGCRCWARAVVKF